MAINLGFSPFRALNPAPAFSLRMNPDSKPAVVDSDAIKETMRELKAKVADSGYKAPSITVPVDRTQALKDKLASFKQNAPSIAAPVDRIQTLKDKLASINQNAPSSIMPEDIVEISEEARVAALLRHKGIAPAKAVDCPASSKVVPNDPVTTETKTPSIQETGTASLATRDDRIAAAKNYDGILAGLRIEYGEAEAMRRFDEIMKADGWEVTEKLSPSWWTPQFMANPSGMGNPGFLYAMTESLFNGLTSLGFNPNNNFASTSSLSTQTSLTGYMDGGQAHILASTWATYKVDTSAQDSGLIGINRQQYVYQKKLSDSFDPNADMVAGARSALIGTNTEWMVQVEKMALDALATGKEIQSTTTELEFYAWLSENDRSGLHNSGFFNGMHKSALMAPRRDGYIIGNILTDEARLKRLSEIQQIPSYKLVSWEGTSLRNVSIYSLKSMLEAECAKAGLLGKGYFTQHQISRYNPDGIGCDPIADPSTAIGLSPAELNKQTQMEVFKIFDAINSDRQLLAREILQKLKENEIILTSADTLKFTVGKDGKIIVDANGLSEANRSKAQLITKLLNEKPEDGGPDLAWRLKVNAAAASQPEFSDIAKRKMLADDMLLKTLGRGFDTLGFDGLNVSQSVWVGLLSAMGEKAAWQFADELQRISAAVAVYGDSGFEASFTLQNGILVDNDYAIKTESLKPGAAAAWLFNPEYRSQNGMRFYVSADASFVQMGRAQLSNPGVSDESHKAAVDRATQNNDKILQMALADKSLYFMQEQFRQAIESHVAKNGGKMSDYVVMYNPNGTQQIIRKDEIAKYESVV